MKFSTAWEEVRLPGQHEDLAWEWFHENSKTSRFDPPLAPAEVAAAMAEMAESLSFASRPFYKLPEPTPTEMPLGQAIRARVSTRLLQPNPIPQADVSALLEGAYGLTRDNRDTNFPRPFRTVPSAGALYPLDLFVYSERIEDLPAGLYHYNPVERGLRLVSTAPLAAELSAALVQPELIAAASVLVLVTATFERSVFKYGERGYRFVLLEAGHVAQNLGLISAALHLGHVAVGGYYDRAVDAALGLDGITQSTVHISAMGAVAGVSDRQEEY